MKIKQWFDSLRMKRIITREVVIFFCITLILFLINAFHEQYTDEWDNLLGGYYILHGILPFSGFFTHHGPAAYFVSAFVQIFSGHSFVTFRVVYETFLTIGIFAWYWYLTSRFGKEITRFYLYFAILYGIAATYFWGHMLVADSLSGYLLGFVYIFFILKYIYKQKFILKDIIFISILTSAALLTSLTYIYLCFGVYFFTLYSYYMEQRSLLHWKSVLRILFILAAPYIIFLFYLIVTGSLGDYVYQAIIFNQKYYIYNYPGIQNGNINPIRFAIVIFHDFYENFFTLLVQLSSFNFANPFNITLALVNVALLAYTLLRRNYTLFFFVFMFIVYANARSNPLTSKETDYQSAVYIISSLATLCFILAKFYSELHLPLDLGKKTIIISLFILTGVYSFFTVGWLTNKFFDKAYGKYMGTAPLIYDRPNYANAINAVIGRSDYIWIGPLEFEEYYYAFGKPASKYHILIPGMGNSAKIQQEFLADMNAHMPKIIIFKENESILGYDPKKYGSYFINWLNQNYVTILNYSEGGVHYNQVAAVDSNYDIEANMYINKNDANYVISKLLSANIIKPVSE